MVDFREVSSRLENGIRHIYYNDEAHGKVIDLAGNSAFDNCDDGYINNLRITNYDPRILSSHHKPGKHEYFISDYILNADVIINMPKPKTHRKAGVTISLKNMIGANVRKDLPHHSMGSKQSGGDEYSRKNIFKTTVAYLLDRINMANHDKQYKKVHFYNFLRKINNKLATVTGDQYSEGSWYGNNTISKTIADVNKIVYYSDKNGNMCRNPQRKSLIIADMIVSGEKEGPVLPSLKNVGAIVLGEDALVFDMVVATMMGMDVSKVPTLNQFDIIDKSKYMIKSNNAGLDCKCLSDIDYNNSWKFEPSAGWFGHIEMK